MLTTYRAIGTTLAAGAPEIVEQRASIAAFRQADAPGLRNF